MAFLKLGRGFQKLSGTGLEISVVISGMWITK